MTKLSRVDIQRTRNTFETSPKEFNESLEGINFRIIFLCKEYLALGETRNLNHEVLIKIRVFVISNK